MTVTFRRGAFNEGTAFSDGDVLFLSGYLPVLERLIVGFTVETAVVVDSVDTTASGVVVRAATQSLTADVVLVTVPLGVLKHGTIIFAPPLDAAKLGATDPLGMGLLNKVVRQFDEVFWDSDADLLGYVGAERGLFSEWLDVAKYTGEPILIGFNASSVAEQREPLSDDEIVSDA